MERPLLPDYVFLRYTHRWPDANAIDGVKVLTYAGNGGNHEPHCIKEDDLSKMENMVAVAKKPDDPFEKGELLRITSGDWTNYFGTYKRRQHGQANRPDFV